MANSWHETLVLAGRSAAQMRRGRKSTTEYSADDGVVVCGWVLKSLHYPSSERLPGTAFFEEHWGQRKLVLGTNGKIYEYSEGNTEYGPKCSGGHRIETSKLLRLSSRQYLRNIGGGEPFAELNTLLEQLLSA